MPMRRRDFLHVAACALAAPTVARTAYASDYPTRPIKLLVGFPPGNAPDIMARFLGQYLSERLGQPFVIDNRPGAASSIAVEAAVNAAPDGYTLIMLVATNIFNMATNPNLRFNLLQDIEPIASIADAPYVLLVNRSVPATSVAEFVAYAKANPGKINIATGSKGSAGHVFGLLLKMLADIDIVHVYYRGNYMTDIVSGQVQAAIVPTPQALPSHQSGEVRLLGVSTARRLALLPNVPTIAESVPGYEALGWYGLGGPKGLPAAVIQKLNAALNEALQDEKIKDRFATMGIQPMAMSPPDFGKFMARDYEKWSKVVKESGVQMD
jgi:tripartite-type tricarboxylate transporter receptor subunit TctC